MFRGCQNKQRQVMRWCGVLVFVLFLVPAGARAATILAAMNIDGNALGCENPFGSIGGEDVAGRALVLGLDLGYNVQVDTSGRTSGRLVNNPIGIRKNLDACTPLLFQALVQRQRLQVVLTIFDVNAVDGSTQARTRITLDQASVVAVQTVGDASSEQPQMASTQELVQILAQQVAVEDLVTGASFQFDFATNR